MNIRTAGKFWCIGLLLLAGACATPDVRPFAEQTAALQGAIATETKEIDVQYGRYIDLIDEARDGVTAKDGTAAEKRKADERRQKFDVQKAAAERNRARYAAAMGVVNRVMSEARTYADTVAALAAKGETGAAAAESVFKTVKGFATTTAALVGGPILQLPADLAGSVAGRVLKEVGTAWTRYQAQQGLADATAAAQGPIDTIEKGVGEIYGDVAQQHIDALYIQTAAVQRIALRTPYYRVYQRYRNSPALAALAGNSNATPAEIDAAAKLTTILQAAKADYDRYNAGLAASAAWKESRLAAAKAISEAVVIWAGAHRQVTEALRKCGGLKAFRNDCGVYSAANLTAAIRKIEEVTGRKLLE